MINTYPDYKLVRLCLNQIEEKLDWGDTSTWHNDMFGELSERIQGETQVLLSPTTLKRVWGRINYQSAPSISTLNTLAQFAGFENWRDFKNSPSHKPAFRLEKKILQNIGIIVTSAAILTIAFISFYSMVGPKNNSVLDMHDLDLKFASRPVTQGLPNSVVFDFDLSEVRSDSIKIQQFWDVTKTIELRKDQKQATGIYYYPGHYLARLLVGGKQLTAHSLFIPSDGWMATLDYEPIPKYLKESRINSHKLSLPMESMQEISQSDQPMNSSFHFIKDFGAVSGDNIRINTSIRNTFREKWAVCQTTKIVILGTTGALIIPFTIPGCVSDIGVMLNDIYLSGKEQDLSSFGTDLSSFREIDIQIRDRHVSVSIDQSEIFSGVYDESIGNFVGMRYRFLGAGEVENLRVEQIDSKVTILENGKKE